MGFFTPSFDKPGKGVNLDAPPKRSFFRFFEVFFRKFTHFVKVNLLYTLTLIPTFIIIFILSGIVTNGILGMQNIQGLMHNLARQMSEFLGDMSLEEDNYMALFVNIDMTLRIVITYLFIILWGMGPATAGVTYVLRNFAREEHAWIWGDFKDSFKSNFKQSIVIFGIDILLFVVFYIAIAFYSNLPGIMGTFKYLIVAIIFVYTIMHLYIYPIMITFKLSLKDIYRNSFLFALGKLPSNLLVLAILILVHIGPILLALQFAGEYFIMILGVLLLLEILILLSFSSFLVNFNAYPKMKKYMLDNIGNELKSDIFSDDNIESTEL